MDTQTTRCLVQAVQELSAARTLDRIRAIVRSVAREIAGADGATFVLRDGDLCHYVDEDAIGPLWKGQKFSLLACISGWTMLHRTSATVPDIYQDPRVPIDAYRPTFVKSLVMVPIREADPIGAIGVYWARPHTAGGETVELLQALANSTAVAMENVRLYEELESRVRTRTSQLEAINAELESFSYSVSHDLRAPVRHMIGFAELLRQHIPPDFDSQGRDYLERIEHSAHRMSHLIDDLLAFARLGRASLDKTTVDLASIAREAQREVMPDAAGRTIEWQLPDAPVAVQADAVLLRQALTNLLSNAVKFTGRRESARIEVGATDDRTRGEHVVFVRDNGAGFDPAYTDRLFGPFQRLHSRDEFDGNGIGLANVRRIIHRHGGRTWAEGAIDQGASFWFTLPHSS
jgi:signal transduction histidine kinase